MAGVSLIFAVLKPVCLTEVWSSVNVSKFDSLRKIKSEQIQQKNYDVQKNCVHTNVGTK